MTNAFVRKLASYAALNDEEARLLSSASAARRQVAAYRDLVREGDRSSGVLTVLEGWLCRYRVLPDGNRQITAFMMPGDFCDPYTSCLERMDHSIGTVTKADVALVSCRDMEILTSATLGLADAFRRYQLAEQSMLRAWIVNIGRRDALSRVASLLLELLLRLKAVGMAEDNSCPMPLTQITLADALGLTAVHVNRMLRILKKNDVMSINAGSLVVHDMPALTRIAGGLSSRITSYSE